MMVALTASLAIRSLLAKVALVPATDQRLNMIGATAIANSRKSVSIQSPFSV
jgi:hypothetical protein